MDVTSAILAGGLGTRLRPAVADRPKVLASVGGRPYLTYLLGQLARASVREAVLLIGYRGEQVREMIGNSYEGMRLRYSVEESPLGTAGALRRALPLLTTPTVLLLNGDSFCDADLDGFRLFHRENCAAASLVLTRVSDTSRFGRVEVLRSGRVERFEEKGSARGRGWINAGIYLVERERIAALPPSQPLSLERDALPAWIAEGCVFGFRHEGCFLDIGTPESYGEAESFFREPALASHAEGR
jgi:D-glycero-alpha-D-manno-heptose 1-phosphate guanylyltransferase